MARLAFAGSRTIPHAVTVRASVLLDGRKERRSCCRPTCFAGASTCAIAAIVAVVFFSIIRVNYSMTWDKITPEVWLFPSSRAEACPQIGNGNPEVGRRKEFSFLSFLVSGSRLGEIRR